MKLRFPFTATAAATAATVGLLSLLAACADMQPGVAEAMTRPAEQALVVGLRAYDDANYPEAEKQLKDALQKGLQAYKDRAAAHKHLAFIYCTSNRKKECEGAFRAARQADPNFALSKSETGHPQWGVVFKNMPLQ